MHGMLMCFNQDLHKAMESVCKLADKNRDGEVEVTAVDLFLRMLEKDLAHNSTVGGDYVVPA